MTKKIIFIFVITISTGMISCSMWDDVDKNTPFEIPVASINVGNSVPPEPTQWNEIPVLLDKFTGNFIMPSQDLTEIKIATNSTHDVLYFKIKASSNIDMGTGATDFVILFTWDYNCGGKKILLDAGANYSIINICDSTAAPVTVYSQSTLYTSLRSNSPFLEVFINLNSTGLNLPKKFMVSIYSTGNTFPYLPIKSSPFKWVKFPD